MIEWDVERRKIEAVASEYKSKGYEVILQPGPDQLPPFLRGTAPDLVAISPTDKVIVEVKEIGSLRASEDLQDFADRVVKQPGWRFELITVRPRRAHPSESPRWSPTETDSRLEEAKRLGEKGHKEAAFLLAYAATEAALFSWARSWGGVSMRQPNALAIAKRMVVSGALARRELARFESFTKQRNALVHGMSTPPVRRLDVEALVAFAHKVQNAPRG